MSGPPSGSPAATLPQQAKFGWRYRDHPRRILTFRLDGTARLPATPPPGAEQPLASDALKPDPAQAARGAAAFNDSCMTCHGVGAVASGAAPDLRASPIPLDAGLFRQVVRDGLLLRNGMPKFGELDDQTLLDLRQYIRQQANPGPGQQTGAARSVGQP